jgi:shikimate dehydrogenase
MGLDAVYVPFQVNKAALESSIKGLRALGVSGFNVTAPYKVRVIPHLDKVEKSAAEIGSVNTVTNNKGKLCGFNTDGIGALNALKEIGKSLEGESILIFGAGGASRAVAHTLAPYASSIRLVNRTIAKAKQLSFRLRMRFNVDAQHAALESKSLRAFVEQAGLIVNASSMGTDGIANPPVKAGWLHADQCVFDMVYRPFQTKLLELASRAGAKTVTGLDMLVNQGACSFELWTGRKAPILEMRQSIARIRQEMVHAQSS